MKLAAHNNAVWCDAVCRAHGIPGRFLDDAWVNPQRTPQFYPDAVTLTPHADVLGMIDRSAGAGIKDSFAALDLSAEGFSVLFDAQWIYHPPSTLTTDRQWHVVRDDAFPAALWDDPSVRKLASGDSSTVLNHSGDAVGVSNVDGPAWDWIVAAITEIWPGLPIVGYEQDVAEPLRHGFDAVGPLRIWVS
jgi:hypothetical protein